MFDMSSLLDEQNKRLENLNSSQTEIVRLLKGTTEKMDSSESDDELRSELRLLTKTLANVLSSRGS